jgi:hypothetical protein
VANQTLRDVIKLQALTIPPTTATSAEIADRAAAMADAAKSYDQVVTAVRVPDMSKSIDDPRRRGKYTSRRDRWSPIQTPSRLAATTVA